MKSKISTNFKNDFQRFKKSHSQYIIYFELKQLQRSKLRLDFRMLK